MSDETKKLGEQPRSLYRLVGCKAMKVWITKDAVNSGRKQCFTSEPKIVGNHYEGQNRVVLGRRDTPMILEVLLGRITDDMEPPCAVCVTISIAPNKAIDGQ